MIFAGSVIYLQQNCLKPVKEFLSDYKQLEIYSEAEDGTQLVVAFEVENDMVLQDLCLELKKNACITDIAHHYFYFEDEVEKALQGEKPELTGFFKSKRKERMEDN